MVYQGQYTFRYAKTLMVAQDLNKYGVWYFDAHPPNYSILVQNNVSHWVLILNENSSGPATFEFRPIL